MKTLESNLIKFNEKLYIKRAELIKRNNYTTEEGYKKWIERKLSKKLKK